MQPKKHRIAEQASEQLQCPGQAASNPVSRPSSASRPAQMATSISAMPIRRCSISTWRDRAAGASCCASRTSTRPAAGRSSRRRSMRTWPGSACPGRCRCGGSRSISAEYRRALDETVGAGSGLSRLRKPCRDREAGGRAGSARRLAARSRWRAALSRRRQAAFVRRAHAPDRVGRALCVAARHGSGDRAGRRAQPGRSTAKAPMARREQSPPARKPGATSSWRARRRRPAITSRL